MMEGMNNLVAAIESYYVVSQIIGEKYDEWKNITKNNYNNDEVMDEHIKEIESYQKVIDMIYDIIENNEYDGVAGIVGLINNKDDVLENLGELYIMCKDALKY